MLNIQDDSGSLWTNRVERFVRSGMHYSTVTNSPTLTLYCSNQNDTVSFTREPITCLSVASLILWKCNSISSFVMSSQNSLLISKFVFDSLHVASGRSASSCTSKGWGPGAQRCVEDMMQFSQTNYAKTVVTMRSVWDACTWFYEILFLVLWKISVLTHTHVSSNSTIPFHSRIYWPNSPSEHTVLPGTTR